MKFHQSLTDFLKLFLFGSIFLFSLPSFFALTMQITTPLAASYSYGDTVSVDGYIFTERFFQGTMTLSLICNESDDLIISQRSISLGQNTKTALHDLLTTTVLLQQPLGKECSFLLTLKDDDHQYEETSSSFLITTTLYGEVTPVNDHVALGEELWIKGRFFTPKGKDINGSIVFSVKQEERAYYLGKAPVEQGILDARIPIKNLPEGTYKLFYEVSDAFGNHMQFAGPFITIIPSASFSLILPKTQVKPYEELSFLFNANTYSYDVAVQVFEHHYLFHENTTNATHEIAVPLLKKGLYPFEATYRDALGNILTEIVHVQILSRLTTLSLELPKKEWLQNESLRLIIKGFDQDGDPYPLAEEPHRYALNILSSGNALVVHAETKQPFFTFPLTNISPGNYTLVVFDQQAGVDADIDFVVKGIPRLQIVEKDGKYQIVNTGTAPYEDTLVVTLKTLEGEEVIENELTLLPDEMAPLTDAAAVEEIVLEDSKQKSRIPATSIESISGSLVFPSLGSLSLGALFFGLLGIIGWLTWKRIGKGRK